MVVGNQAGAPIPHDINCWPAIITGQLMRFHIEASVKAPCFINEPVGIRPYRLMPNYCLNSGVTKFLVGINRLACQSEAAVQNGSKKCVSGARIGCQPSYHGRKPTAHGLKPALALASRSGLAFRANSEQGKRKLLSRKVAQATYSIEIKRAYRNDENSFMVAVAI
jgi:hypothetical protein